MLARVTTFFKGYPVLLIAVAIAGPASASTAQDVSELVRSWIGHAEAELLEVWGESVSMDSESGGTLRIYSARGAGGGGPRVSGSINSFPVGGGRSGTNRADDAGRTMREYGGCDVSFEIRRGVVVDVSWTTEGSPDRDLALRTCWREFRRNEPE
jgi:hypothetical protein